MNYKKIIKSRAVREKILRALAFIPDRPMLCIQYRIKTGRRLNLKHPERFTEKLQWYKLYYHDPRMIACVDKYDVREYVHSRGYGYILNQCYGVFDRSEEIWPEALPGQFVLKDTLGSGGNAVILCPDKNSLDWAQVKRITDKWCSIPLVRDGGREWPYYSGKKHRIMVEEFLQPPPCEELRDYKFFCFGGKTAFVYVCSQRQGGQSVQIDLVSRDYEKLEVTRVGDEPTGPLPEKPKNFAEMRKIAEALSTGFPHVRVDLYSLNGTVRFGELTFFNASGYMIYDPDEFDVEIGRKFTLPPKQKLTSDKYSNGSRQ